MNSIVSSNIIHTMAEKLVKLGGHEYIFLEPTPDDLICLICMLVSKDPRQLTCCGKIFCTSCLEGLGENQPCPHCREKEWESFPDKKSARSISNLKIKCLNSRKECSWTGELRGHNDHTTVCEQELIECENHCWNSDGDIIQLLRKDTKRHMLEECTRRLVKCELCGEESEYGIINGDHYYHCLEQYVECGNEGCGTILKRGVLQDGTHEEVCEHALVECKYAEYGCGKVVRKDLVEHEKDVSLHLETVFKTMKEMQEEVNRASNIKYLKLLDAVKSIDQTLQGLHGDVTQLQELRHPPPPLGTAFNNAKGLVVATFKMTDFEHHKNNNKCFYSPSFYTAPNSYKMSIRIQPNDEFISIYVDIVPGKNNDYLKCPSENVIVEVQLLNQLSDSRHLSNRFYFRTNAQGHCVSEGDDKAIPLKKFEQQYTCNDSLYFRVTIHKWHTINKPWLVCTV